MAYSIEPLFDRATRHLEREARRLQALQQSHPFLPVGSFDSDGIVAISKAMTFVVCGGILEQLMRDLPIALSSDIMALGVKRGQVPVGLLSILEASKFRRCAGQDAGTFSVRADLLRSIASHASDSRIIVDFSSDLTLADGKTVGIKQFVALWDMLELRGDWRNDPNDSLLLQELQRKRNDVAHWDEDPVTIGRSKTYDDLLKISRSLGLLLDHVNLHLCEWLDAYR